MTGFYLEQTAENTDEIDAIAHHCDARVGLDGVLADLKYAVRPVRRPRLRGRAVHQALRWNAYDTGDPRWWPQGLSTPGLSPRGRSNLLVATWYSKEIDGANHGSRITVINLDTGHYRHVLLVAPKVTKSGPTFAPLRIHAGGIAWTGDYLHVAATKKGFFTASLDDIMRVPGDDDERPQTCGIEDGRVASYAHRYVLPVRLAYRAHTEPGEPALRYSFMSLDESEAKASLLVGEYASSDEGTTRLARYALDPTTCLLRVNHEHPELGAVSRPVEVAQDGVRQMQGVTVIDGRFYVGVSRGPLVPSSVYVGRPGHLRAHHLAAPIGTEDFCFDAHRRLIWSVTEHPRRRWIYAMRPDYFE